ncbi:MAG: 4Fe-4S binding protein [Nanoarchaeota archaeon]|nr:4Fe-4S binding protein [Nanoarchaeota archaeon]
MSERRKNLITLIIGIALIVIFGYYVIPRQLKRRLAFFWSNTHYYIIYFALVIAFIILFLILFKKIKVKDNTLKIVYGLIFLPIALFPAFRCYFKIPYIFCRQCPEKCPWGVLRPFIIPSFLLLNLDRRFWCYKLCPFGTLQDLQYKVSPKRICLPKWLINIRYIFLIFVIVVIVRVALNPEFYGGMFKGEYHFAIISFSVVTLIFLIAFFIPRFWCNYFCPIGSFGDLMLKVQNKISKNFK